MKTAFLVTSVAAMALASGAQAQSGRGWQFVGAKAVGANTDTDRVLVNSNRRFRQLRVCVQRAPIHMIDFDIFYRNGSREDVQLRSRFRPGGCSRNIDLRGEARHITQIRMRYERIRAGGPMPFVTVSGR